MSSVSKDSVKFFYDEHSTRKLKDYIYGNLRVAKATDAIKKNVQVPIKSVLDIGCGIGQVANSLAQFYTDSKVYGFDISEKSIRLAKQLFENEHIKFERADTLMEWNLPLKVKFDLIVLMDVYEHIPNEERSGLYKFIKDRLMPGGTVFLSCPTPAFLAWLKINEPANIQPVDEDITIKELLDLANGTNTEIKYYQQQLVWRSGDYFYACLSNSPFAFLHQSHIQKLSIVNRIIRKLQQKLNINNNSDYINRKLHVEKATGLKL